MRADFHDTFSFHAPASGSSTGDTALVPDAHLLFTAEFKRSGTDLKLTGDDGGSFVVRDYFASDKRPTLIAPDGAALTADVVELLAG